MKTNQTCVILYLIKYLVEHKKWDTFTIKYTKSFTSDNNLEKKNSSQKTKLSSSALLLIISVLLLLVSWTTSSSAIDNFIQCLSNHSQPTNPIFDAIYTPNNSTFPSALLSYIRNRRFSTPTTPKPLAIVAAMHESHVQATILCASIMACKSEYEVVAMTMRAFHMSHMCPLLSLTCLISDPSILI
jgi:hypothetical protein